MLAGRYRQGASGPRPKGRLVLIGLGGVVLAIVLAEVFYQVANSSQGAARREASSWSAGVSGILAQSGALSIELHDVRQLKSLPNRVAMTNLLDDLAHESVQCLSQLNALSLGAPSRRQNLLAHHVLQARARGVLLLRSAINALTTPGSSAASGASLFVQAGASFESADQDLARLSRQSKGEIVGASKWISSPSAWNTAAAARFAHNLSVNRLYLLRHGLKLVALSLAPAPLRITGLPTTTSTTSTTLVGASGPSGVVVSSTTTLVKLPRKTVATPTTLQIPPVSAVAVMGPIGTVRAVVVLANSGNTDEQAITISAHLVALAANGKPLGVQGNPAQQTLASLAPTSSRYLMLPAISLDPKISSYRLELVISDPDIRPITAAVTLRSGS